MQQLGSGQPDTSAVARQALPDPTAAPQEPPSTVPIRCGDLTATFVIASFRVLHEGMYSPLKAGSSQWE